MRRVSVLKFLRGDPSQIQSFMDSLKKEWLLDRLSRFVSSSGLIYQTVFESGQILKCPTAVCYGRGQNLGIGTDPDFYSAMIKALAEVLERYTLSGYAKKQKKILYNKTSRELIALGYTCFYPEEALFEDFVYETRPYCRKLTPDTKTDWVPAGKFSENQTVWLPASLIYYSPHNTMTNILKRPTSNGMSCSFFDSAVEDSLLELIERDTFLYMWLAKSPGEEITVDEVQNSSLKRILEIIGDKKRQIKLIYKQTDTKTPCVYVLFKGKRGFDEPSFFITGKADPDIERACYRALVEFIQGYNMVFINRSFFDRKMRKASGKNPQEITDFIDRVFYMKYENFEKCAFLFDTTGRRRLSDCPAKVTDEKTVFLKNALKDKKVFIADVTPSEMEKSGVSVVRAYSPDLLDIEHSEKELFNFLLKKKRIDGINKMSGEKTDCLNLDPHCYL